MYFLMSENSLSFAQRTSAIRIKIFGCILEGTFYLLIANFFATQIVGGIKELGVLLLLSGNI